MAKEACVLYNCQFGCEKWSESILLLWNGFFASILSLFMLCHLMCEKICSSAGLSARPVLTISVELIQTETGLNSLMLLFLFCVCYFVV